MTEAPHPQSRAALEQRFGARYRWWVLLTVMVGTIASAWAAAAGSPRLLPKIDT